MELPSADALSRDRRQESARGTDNAVLPRQPEPRAPESKVAIERQRWADRLEKIENPVSSRAELRERLNSFEPGHPSSPWDEHGKPRGEAWVAERRAVHDEIIREIYDAAANVPCEQKAVIAGGLGGAGKNTVLEQHANIDRSAFLTINPDDFKEELAKRGLVPDVPGLAPMEASSLAHEESSHIARMLAGRALADGKNVIWDVTLSTQKSAVRRVEELRDAGYQHIEGIFVDIPIETSVTRAIERHRRGNDRYLAGEGFGGRYVSEDIIRSQTDTDHGSINRGAFEGIKHQLTYWAIYDNSVGGRSPVLLAEGRRKDQDRIHDPERLG